MKPFVDCKYESIYNVLKFFNKDIVLLNLIYYFKYYKEDEIIKYKPESKIDFKNFLKIYKIEESSFDKTSDLINFLKCKLETYQCAVIKTDLYYQSFSKKYYRKKHKKHNIFIKKVQENDVKIIENEFADSEKYIEMDIAIEEIEEWYYGYISNFYEKGLDTADTLYFYKENSNVKIEYNEFNRILTSNEVLQKENRNIILEYIENNNKNEKSELQTYLNLIGCAMKEKERAEIIGETQMSLYYSKVINILHKLQRTTIYKKENEKNIEIEKLTKLLIQEKKGNEYLKNKNIIYRVKDKYKTSTYKDELKEKIFLITDIHILNNNLIIELERENNNNLEFFKVKDANLKQLIHIISCEHCAIRQKIEIDKQSLYNVLKQNGYIPEYINVQKNSINGYANNLKKQKVFFKILNKENTENELKGYCLIFGKFEVSKIERILIYDNYCIIIFVYDITISKDQGLLNDLFVENDFNKIIDQTQKNKINIILNEDLKYLKGDLYTKSYPMQIFFNDRVEKRLTQWYKDNIVINYKGKIFELNNIVSKVQDYFKKENIYQCFLSQGDPNSLNIGLKPILFDYATSGYNAIIAEFCTMLWSILFNDLFFAPKYHKNSYKNHEKIIKTINEIKPQVNYSIDGSKINIYNYELKTSAIRKEFMLEYIKKIKENNIYIGKNFIFFIIMRILCIFDLNYMDKDDKVYSLSIMIELLNRNNSKEVAINLIEEFINELGEI